MEPEQLNACGHGGGFVSCKAEKSLIPAAVAVDSSLARLKKVSSLRPCPAEQRLEGLEDSVVGLLGYFNVPCAVDFVVGTVDFAVGTVDFAVVGGMAFSRCRRQATAAKKKAVGKFVPASARSSPCLRGSAPPRKLLRWDGFQPLPPIGDSRKKKGRWGNLCLLPHAHPLACGGLPHLGNLTP